MAQNSEYQALLSPSHDGSSASPFSRHPYSRPITQIIKETFCVGWPIKLLFLAIPFVFTTGTFSPAIVFLAAFLGLVPLAAILGEFTEDISLHTNTIMGLVANLIFGNAVVVLLLLAAMRRGMFEVVKLSLIGSFLSITMLVLGSVLFMGGIRHPVMYFNRDAVSVYAPLLFLSTFTIMVPSLIPFIINLRGSMLMDRLLSLSHIMAILTLCVFVSYLAFHTSNELPGIRMIRLPYEPKTPRFPFWYNLCGVVCTTGLIAILSETLCVNLGPAAALLGAPQSFIALIMIPVIINTSDHLQALNAVLDDDTDTAIGIVLNSGLQVLLLLLPSLVLLAWYMSMPLDLTFTPYLLAITIVSVLVVGGLTMNGKSNWLEGAMLMISYALIGWTFLLRYNVI